MAINGGIGGEKKAQASRKQHRAAKAQRMILSYWQRNVALAAWRENHRQAGETSWRQRKIAAAANASTSKKA